MNEPDAGHSSPPRGANVGAAVLHAAQDPVVIFDIPTKLAVAGFLALSVLPHLLV